MASVSILGAGTWGIALARMLYNSGNAVTVWSAIKEEIGLLSSTHKHPHLPAPIPEGISYTTDIAEACSGRDIIVFAVPSVYVRETARKAKPYIPEGQLIVNVAKGLEFVTNYTITEVLADELNDPSLRLVALSGPTHAEEVAADLHTAIVAASENIEDAEIVQRVFSNSAMRVYTNRDAKGIEICGALKNVIALAAGIARGIGLGDNAKAALMTRGMVEITRLGSRMGCFPQTFESLAGIGDLIVTCTSEHSRNNRAGFFIGQGCSADEATEKVGMVVEGLNTLPAALQLSREYDIELPICEAVAQVVFEHKAPKDALNDLMARKQKSELREAYADEQFEGKRHRRRIAFKRRVITYGSFDLLHYGHLNLLRRAKALGDYLVVGLSTDEFSLEEKQKKCYLPYEQRKKLLESIRYVDLVIPETCWEQKKTDIHEHHIDKFVMGGNWEGKFDFLKDEGVEVIYLPRTPDVKPTQAKQDTAGK